ncbi:hypothetical protein Tco_0395826, partial [Tanacetum coccineum]
EAEYVALSASCAQVMWMSDTTSRLWLQLQQNTVVLRLSVSHSNLIQPCTTFTDKAHPYWVSVHEACQKDWYEMFDSSRTGGSDK